MSRPVLRTWAWITGAISFFVPAAALGLEPPPAIPVTSESSTRPVVIVRRIIRRVVIDGQTSAAPVRTVYVSSPQGQAGTAPVTSTGGS